MSITETKSSVEKMPEVTIPGKAKLILTRGVQEQINYLHQKVGGIEWCGILFFSQLEGELKNPESLVLKAEHIYLMDIGSHAYTEAQVEGLDIINMYESVPNAEKMRQGLIHTHHTMQTFFSGTDMDELHQNAELHNYYVSLIVNFSGNYTAKIAYVAKGSSTSSLMFNNSDDTQVVLDLPPTEKKYLVMINLDIEKEAMFTQITDTFQERYNEIKEEKEKKKTQAYKSTHIGFTNDFRDFIGQGEYPKASKRQPSLFDDVKEESLEIQKQKALDGTLYGMNGKKIGASHSELKSVILKWLNAGLDISMQTRNKSGFSTIDDALTFYENHYYGIGVDDDADYFVNQMSRLMIKYFEDYSELIIEEKMGDLLFEKSDQYSIALDLANAVNSYSDYLETLNSFAIENSYSEEAQEDLKTISKIN